MDYNSMYFGQKRGVGEKIQHVKKQGRNSAANEFELSSHDLLSVLGFVYDIWWVRWVDEVEDMTQTDQINTKIISIKERNWKK